MKLFITAISFLSAAALTTCKPETSETNNSTSGCVIEFTDNYVTIVSAGSDTLTYSIANIEKLPSERILLRDSILITYKNDFGFCDATSIIVVGHNLPYINNRTEMLLGTWSNNDGNCDESDSLTLTFNSDNTVDINMKGNPTREQWLVEGKSILLGNNMSDSQKYDVVRVDNETLTMCMGKEIVHFKKTID
ncbi:MAG: hypothetical protein J6Y82_07570 [Bacteroidales bacterium]|nr:hypothetical protein [Bacteroidales bacterium]